MARQARGAATRQKILEAAIELFTDNGFGVTTLNDIADRAELTSGALYYHFESKEALAIGIIDEGWPKTWDLIVKHLDSAALGLESVIRMTFALTDLMQRDNLLWLAHHLGQTFGQANLEARDGCQKRMTMFIDRVAEAVRPSDLGDGITPQAVGTYFWLVTYGSELLSRTLMENCSARLAANWMMLLRSISSADSLRYFEQFLVRTAEQFGAVDAV